MKTVMAVKKLVNPFMRKVEEWPNMLEKSCGSHRGGRRMIFKLTGFNRAFLYQLSKRVEVLQSDLDKYERRGTKASKVSFNTFLNCVSDKNHVQFIN